MCHTKANWNSFVQVSEHATLRRTVNVDFLTLSGIGRGNDEGFLLYIESYVTDKTRVQNAMNLLLVVNSSVSTSDYFVDFFNCVLLHDI